MTSLAFSLVGLMAAFVHILFHLVFRNTASVSPLGMAASRTFPRRTYTFYHISACFTLVLVVCSLCFAWPRRLWWLGTVGSWADRRVGGR